MFQRLLKTMGVSDEPVRVHHTAPARMSRQEASIAQEVLLASIDPASGKSRPAADYAIAAALLGELSIRDRLEVDGEGRGARFTVVDQSAVGDAELDASLRALTAVGRAQKVTSNVVLLPGVQRFLPRLVADGVVVAETEKKLGLFSSQRLRVTAAAGRDEIVDRVRSAVLGEAVPDQRLGLLVASLYMADAIKLTVPRSRAREADRAAVQIGEQLSPSVRALVSAVNVEMMRGDDYASAT